MAIALEELTKRYGPQTVVDRVSLQVADGELFVLLGPSGSGKTTILRMIAGLTPLDGGRITLCGRDVASLPARERKVGFVFQDYSLFRHMNVAENIEFGLKIRGCSASDRARRRDELLDLIDLKGLGARSTDQLSGGQQQRIAVARALAYWPEVLLLDEPFGALDVKTRQQLRRALREIVKQLKVTTILVTHDQDEAFELADRIGVIDHGHLLEVGDPAALYLRPRSLFVATFVGTGTVLAGRFEAGRARFGPLTLPCPDDVRAEEGATAQLLFRPEQVALSPQPSPPGAAELGRGKVVEQTFVGSVRRVRVQLPRLPGARQIAPPLPFGEKGFLIEAEVPADAPLAASETWVRLKGWRVLRRPKPRLVVCCRGVHSESLLDFTRRFVSQFQGSATLLAVAEDSEQCESLATFLRSTLGEREAADFEVSARAGKVQDVILDEISRGAYEVLFFEADERSETGLGRRDSSFQSILEQSAIPALIVPRAVTAPQSNSLPSARDDETDKPAGEPERVGAIRRVLICTAAGEPGKSDVRMGGWVARRLGAEATLLHVARIGGGADPEIHRYMNLAACTLSNQDTKNRTLVREAPRPATGILKEIREGSYDLVVMGRHAPRAKARLPGENVTLRVLNAAQRPVLVVPNEEVG